MKESVRPVIPVNIIAGPLGVGKTTTINHLLSQRPDDEHWAVLVNEYGLVGLDAALMTPAASRGKRAGVEIKEVAGGCICCSAGFMFEVSLLLLLQRHPDRLLIEPTGLAALSGILDALDRPGIREAVDVRSVVCLLDAGRRREDLQRESVQDQVDAADVLLASRSDLTAVEELSAFDTWAKALFPKKAFVGQVANGQLPLRLLDLVTDRGVTGQRGNHQHGTDHDHADHQHDAPTDDSVTDLLHDASHPIVRRSHRSSTASTIGWVCGEGLVFDAERASCWLSRLSQMPGARRAKAVLRTNEGWWGFNFADGIEAVRPSGYRRDSRLEVVIEGSEFPDTDLLDESLRACIASPTVNAEDTLTEDRA